MIHDLRYDIPGQTFFQLPPGHEIQRLPDERVLCLITEFLSGFGRQERFALLLKYRQHRFLKEFLTMLRIVTPPAPIPEDNLEKFLATTVEPCPGANISTAELTAAQTQYFRDMNLPPFPIPVFEKRVPAYIERMFRGRSRASFSAKESIAGTSRMSRSSRGVALTTGGDRWRRVETCLQTIFGSHQPPLLEAAT